MARSLVIAHQRSDAERRSRAIRGSVGSLIVTIFAAASHGAAGGEITGLALIATAILGLPICVALADRVGSLWRLTLAVSTAQFIYHWTFAGLGLDYGTAVASTPMPAHAHHAHHAAMMAFVPGETALAADAAMWASHALAAVLTIVLLHRGERAAISLLRVLRRVVTHRLRPTAVIGMRRAAPPRLAHPAKAFVQRIFAANTITHRGPPAAFAVA